MATFMSGNILFKASIYHHTHITIVFSISFFILRPLDSLGLLMDVVVLYVL